MDTNSKCMMLKLVSGETIISYVLQNENEITLHMPFTPLIIQKNVNDIEIIFKRWVSLTTSNNFVIQKSSVICMLPPEPEIEKMYQETILEAQKTEKEILEQREQEKQLEKELVDAEDAYFENPDIIEDDQMIFENSSELKRKIKNEEELEKKKIPKWRKKPRWKP